MSEFEGIGRVIPPDQARDRPRQRPQRRKKTGDESSEDEFDELDELDETDEEGLPDEVKKKRREGREVGPKAKDEDGQIIDVLA